MTQFASASGNAQAIDLVFTRSEGESPITLKFNLHGAEFALGQIAHFLARVRQDATIVDQHQVASLPIRRLRAVPSENGKVILLSLELEKDIHQHFSMSVRQGTELLDQLRIAVDKASKTAPSSSTSQ